MRVVLIDDEPLARSLVREYLTPWVDIEIIAECDDGFSGIKAILEYQPDLVILDIQMPKINGFEMLELLDNKPDVIFATAFDEYAIKAFETHAVDYLLKPFTRDRFDKAIQKWMDQKQSAVIKEKTQKLIEEAAQTIQHDRVVVKTGAKIMIIPVEDILYLEADDDYVNIHTAGGSFLKNKTMNFFEQTLKPEQFVRVHRSFIIRVQEITRIDPYEKDSHIAILRSGAKIPVSKTGYARLRQVLGI